VSVDTLLLSEAQRQAEVKRVTAAIEQETNKGKDVVVYTTRQVRLPSLLPSFFCSFFSLPHVLFMSALALTLSTR